MKNIHVLPTGETIAGIKTKNIYITSDEEIKKGDFTLSPINAIVKCECEKSKKSIKWDNCKKIILTDNQDLIKDGVQAIDDEFLEWFVKNPSCEVVEVTYGVLKPFQSEDKGYLIHCPDNEVLEETKQDLEKEMFELEQELDIPLNLRWHNSKPKQETLEEFAKQEAIKQYSEDTFGNLIVRKSIEKGAKWQQERMYSEEEVYDILIHHTIELFKKEPITLEDFLNKFKKK